MENERYLRKKINKKNVEKCLFSTFLLIGLTFIMGFYYEKIVYINLDKIVLELGDKLPSDMQKYMDIVMTLDNLSFEDNVPKDKDGNTNKIGVYDYYLVYNDSLLKSSRLTNARSTITVVDTTAPKITLKKENLEVAYGSKINLDEIANCFDLSKCTLSLDKEINTSVSGEYVVNVITTDEGNNTSHAEIKVTVLEKQMPIYYGYDSSIPDMNYNNMLINNKMTLEEKNNLRNEIVNYAKLFIGNPYVYGGYSLTNGTDCSGFTKLIYSNFGYEMPRIAVSQGYIGKEISYDELLPGDLIIYYYENGGGHASIYIGNNLIVHAGTESTGITISSIFSGYKTYRRVIY